METTDDAIFEKVMTDVVERTREILAYRGDDAVVVGPDSRLFDLGDGVASLDLDSLDALDIVAWLEDHYEFELSDDVDLESIQTIRDVVEATLQHLERE